MKRREVYKDAIKKNGKEMQLNVIKEELAELLVAINHYERGKCDIIGVVTEIADVYICLEQLNIIYEISSYLVHKEIEFKIARLAEKIYGKEK